MLNIVIVNSWPTPPYLFVLFFSFSTMFHVMTYYWNLECQPN